MTSAERASAGDADRRSSRGRRASTHQAAGGRAAGGRAAGGRAAGGRAAGGRAFADGGGDADAPATSAGRAETASRLPAYGSSSRQPDAGQPGGRESPRSDTSGPKGPSTPRSHAGHSPRRRSSSSRSDATTPSDDRDVGGGRTGGRNARRSQPGSGSSSDADGAGRGRRTSGGRGAADERHRGGGPHAAAGREVDDGAAGRDPLATYRGMRDPGRTPEPVPPAGPLPEGNDDTFVIQEHHARSLHWDVRLERDGVLVSWAVPKGLPLDPKDNRLAVHTEDHPIDYGSFEGDIPAGEYGGGKVILWDRGRYEMEEWTDREVKVVFHGGRAEGRYVLFQTRGRGLDGSPDGRAAVPGLAAAADRPRPDGRDARTAAERRPPAVGVRAGLGRQPDPRRRRGRPDPDHRRARPGRERGLPRTTGDGRRARQHGLPP